MSAAVVILLASSGSLYILLKGYGLNETGVPHGPKQSSTLPSLLVSPAGINLAPMTSSISTPLPKTTAPKPATITTSSIAPTAKPAPYRVNPVCVSSHLDHIPLADVDKQTTLMQQAGVNWVRFDVLWASIEQTKGVYSWVNYDYVVNSVNSRGMKVLALITQYGIPSWERIDSTNGMSTPNNMQDFQNFVQAFALHYKGQISLYEIGNEPNVTAFWPSGPNPLAYTQLLIAGYNGVKAADPTNKVISAGLANVQADTFLQGMYNAGAKGYYDYIGFHPYSWPQSPDFAQSQPAFSETATIKQIMINNGDGSKQIMATEVGWPSTTASGGVNETTQAAYISRVYQKIEYEGFKYVPIACIYDFIDDGTDLTNREDNFGILRADYSQKPSFMSLQEVGQNFNANFTTINP